MTEFSWSNLAIKLSSFCFLGLLALLPSQLGYHFWPSFSSLSGLRIDYLSPTLYLSDFLLLGLIPGLLPPIFLELRKNHRTYIIGSFVLYLVLLSLFSLSLQNSLYGVIRWLGYSVFAFATWYYYEDIWMLRKSLLVLSGGILYAVLLALWQFFLQHSVGGIFYFMGERTFSGATPGIANASLDGTLVLRPYASFPHPNVLAGFLLLLFWLLFAYRWVMVKRWQRVVAMVSLILAPLGIIVSMSRTTILVWCLLLALSYLVNIRKKRAAWWMGVLGGAGFMILSFILLPRFLTLTLQDETVRLRIMLLHRSVEILQSSPLFGVGIKNFLVVLSHYPLSSLPYSSLQPVHNIFVLLLVEIGFVGLLWGIPFFLSLGKRVITSPSETRFLKGALLISLVSIGTVDHYFYTLHQGQLLLALVLGVLWQKQLPFSRAKLGFPSQKKQISRKPRQNKPQK